MARAEPDALFVYIRIATCRCICIQRYPSAIIAVNVFRKIDKNRNAMQMHALLLNNVTGYFDWFFIIIRNLAITCPFILWLIQCMMKRGGGRACTFRRFGLSRITHQHYL